MSRLRTPVCMTCGVVMRCKKNGFVIKDPAVGNFPSTYWSGDLYKCPKCGVEVLSGTGDGVEHAKAVEIGMAAEAHEFAYNLAEDTPPEKNQCDGCMRGLPVKDGIHLYKGTSFMMCTSDRYRRK